MQAENVGSGAVQSLLEFVSFTEQLVSLGEKVIVLLAETVPVVFDPGSIRLSQLSEQVADEPALGAQLAAELAYFIIGIERPFSPRRFVLSRPLLDMALGVRLCPRLRLSDDRVRGVVFICERARYPGELRYAHALTGAPVRPSAFTAFPTAATLEAAARLRASMARWGRCLCAGSWVPPASFTI